MCHHKRRHYYGCCIIASGRFKGRGDGDGCPTPIGSHFFNKTPFPVWKECSSLCAFAINDNTGLIHCLPSPSFLNCWIRHWIVLSFYKTEFYRYDELLRLRSPWFGAHCRITLSYGIICKLHGRPSNGMAGPGRRVHFRWFVEAGNLSQSHDKCDCTAPVRSTLTWPRWQPTSIFGAIVGGEWMYRLFTFAGATSVQIY